MRNGCLRLTKRTLGLQQESEFRGDEGKLGNEVQVGRLQQY